MFWGLVQAMEFMSSSLLKPLLSIEERRLVYCMVKEPDLHLVLCNAQSFTSETSTEGHHPQSILCKSFKNVAAVVNDIQDEIFWKTIYCLLYAVFPALILRYCDSNIPAMDKIFFLVM